MYDVIIVLGGGVDEKGQIPPNVALRVKESVRLLKDGVVARVIMSGKWSYGANYTPPRTEAEAMKQIAVGLGANTDSILKEESSVDTVGNAYFCKKLFLEPNSWHKVLVLTADHHVERSEYLFRKVLGPNYVLTMHPVGTILTDEQRILKAEHHDKSLALAKQYLDPISDGADATIWQVMSTKHPGYAKNPEVSKEKLLKQLES